MCMLRASRRSKPRPSFACVIISSDAGPRCEEFTRVNQFNPSVQSLFDVLASELQSRLLKGHSGDTRVSWSSDGADQTPSDLIWWSWSLSIDSACRVAAGASSATWKEICGLDAETAPADFGDVIQEAARNRFG